MKINKKSKRIILISVAALLIIGIAVGLTVALLPKDGFDYLTSDLSQLVSIDESGYRGYTVEIRTDAVDSAAVERKIYALRYLNRAKKAEYNSGEVDSVPISVGDKAYIYYRAYLKDGEGRCRLLTPTSKLAAATGYGVGSFAMAVTGYDHSLSGMTSGVLGFDEGLMGVLPSEHRLTGTETVTEGKVAEGDSVVFSYNADGVRYTYVTDLDLCDEVYGTGLKAYLLSAEIGRTSTLPCEVILDGEAVVYNNIKVEYVIRSGNAPLTVEVTFPANYSDPSLRGEVGYIEVWFRGSVVYTAPEYSAEFITDTLGVTEESLAAYEGEDTVERHRAMLFAECERERESVRAALIEEAVWNRLVESADVAELPRSEVERVYNETYSELYSMYSSLYSAIYSSPEEFCAWYYGLGSSDEVADHVLSLAERAITEKLIFYYVARTEGLLPSGDELSAAYNAIVDEYLAYYTEGSMKAELDALDSAAREKRIAEIRTEMIATFGEEYFTELVYYEAAFEAIVGFATVKDI